MAIPVMSVTPNGDGSYSGSVSYPPGADGLHQMPAGAATGIGLTALDFSAHAASARAGFGAGAGIPYAPNAFTPPTDSRYFSDDFVAVDGVLSCVGYELRHGQYTVLSSGRVGYGGWDSRTQITLSAVGGNLVATGRFYGTGLFGRKVATSGEASPPACQQSAYIDNTQAAVTDAYPAFSWAEFYVDHAPVAPPSAAPAGLSGSGVCEGTQATLTWGAVAGATGYRLYRDGALIYDGAAAGFLDAMASLGTTYHYAVSAYNGGGEGPQSSGIAVTPCAVASAPGTPAGLAYPTDPDTGGYACEGPQATLSWDAVPGATGYVLTRDGADVYEGAATTFTDGPLTLGQSHAYRVLATNAVGDSAPSAPVTVTPCAPETCCAWAPVETAPAAAWGRIESPCSR